MHAFGDVALAHVLGQDLDGAAVAGDERLEAAAGANGAQLAVISDHHDLGARRCSITQQLQQHLVVGHRRFVQDNHRALVEGCLTVLQEPG